MASMPWHNIHGQALWEGCGRVFTIAIEPDGWGAMVNIARFTVAKEDQRKRARFKIR
jgi:hypothetical protein